MKVVIQEVIIVVVHHITSDEDIPGAESKIHLISIRVLSPAIMSFWYESF